MQSDQSVLTNLKKVAVRHLTRRSYTEYQLRQKLQLFLSNQPQASTAIDSANNRVDHELIQQVIDYCYRYQWLDDDKYIEDYFYYKSRRGYGAKRIKLELLQRGISEQKLSLYQSSHPTDCFAQLKQLAHKKFPQLLTLPHRIDYQVRAKIVRYFSARGFSFEEINQLFTLSDD